MWDPHVSLFFYFFPFFSPLSFLFLFSSSAMAKTERERKRGRGQAANDGGPLATPARAASRSPSPRRPCRRASPLPQLPLAAFPFPLFLLSSRGGGGGASRGGGARPGLPATSPLSAAAGLSLSVSTIAEEKGRRKEKRREKK